MNSKGQANNVFRLLIYAIVAAVLILLIYNFFIVKPVDATDEMRKSLAYSQANLGKAFTNEIFFAKDFSISAERSLDDSQTNVSFQCLDPNVCGKLLDTTPKRATSLKDGITQVTTRCDYAFTVFSCRVYFGLPPAQVAIEKSEIPTSIDLTKEKAVFKVQIMNIGKQIGSNVFLDTVLYKKEIIENELKELLYSESPEVQFMETLAPNESRGFSIPLKISDNGDFVLKYRVEGIDSGFEEGRTEFKVAGAPEKQNCFIGRIGETTLSIENNLCETQFICTGCGTASECAFRWQQQEPEGEFTAATTDYSITTYQPYSNGTCVADAVQENEGTTSGTDSRENQEPSQPPSNEDSGTPPQSPQDDNPPQMQASDWIWPLGKFVVESCYGDRPYITNGSKFHGGIDVAVPKNTSVVAVDGGIVIRAGSSGCGTGFGNCAVIRHPSGIFSSYNHLEKALVEVGKNVAKGDLIGLSGNSGGNYGYHLHLSVFTRESDVQIGARGKNPVCFFPESVKSKLTFTGQNCKVPNPLTNGC